MANERITEDIVRAHFKKHQQKIIIEEQSSRNPKINKLLKAASKKGAGKGYPEFIIQFKNNSDLLVIIECKSSILRHESKKRDRYKDFAVDGVLLYSSFLSKGFDVISIAVSGETLRELKISHFLQLVGGQEATDIFSNKLLTPDAYLQGYIKSPEKVRQDYDELLVFSRNLNQKLHGHKVVESDRSLLISCILIALENKPFRESYKYYDKPDDLAGQLVETVERMFKNSGIKGRKLDVIESRINFIKTDASLSSKEGVLKEIIIDIEENISKFIRTHEYYDVLGRLYVEFLRYANSDKGLGIVLTPPHITEFMCELGEVNKESVVYDSCTGTGGFLVSAMKYMEESAKNDLNKIRHIKQHQLVGVEYQAHIFTLACSNMFIHQDGKTSILNGDCFDPKIIKKVKKYRPTIGLLNPPYKSDKKSDPEELDFVLSNLECITQGGKCIAILPLQSAIAQNGRILEFKKKLMEKHTLEAVLSMPNDLFFNSKAGVVTCIMVITAKRSHKPNKKTFFGYYKDDGFVKKKNKGRIDGGEWQNIKKSWLDSYTNRKNVPGLSLSREVTPYDEWCVEAYMETDYSQLTKNDFEKEVRKYLAFKARYL